MTSVDSENHLYTDNEVRVGPGVMVFVRGLPGSGKSTLSVMISDSFTKGNVELIDPDMVDKTSPEYLEFCRSEAESDPGADPRVYLFRYLLHNAKESLSRSRIVIWNQPFTHLENFIYTIDEVRKSDLNPNKTPVLIVDILVDAEVAREKMNKRKLQGGHGPDDEYFYKLVHQFGPITEAIVGCEYLVVETERGFESQLSGILDIIKRNG